MIQGNELAELMQQSAEDAKNFAKQEFDIELDGSVDSLERVDQLISKTSLKIKSEDEKAIFTISTILGAYVGEIFRLNHGGEWIYDTSNPEAPAVFLKFNNLTFAFPGIVYQRLMQEPNVSVCLYFKEASVQSTKHSN